MRKLCGKYAEFSSAFLPSGDLAKIFPGAFGTGHRCCLSASGPLWTTKSAAKPYGCTSSMLVLTLPTPNRLKMLPHVFLFFHMTIFLPLPPFSVSENLAKSSLVCPVTCLYLAGVPETAGEKYAEIMRNYADICGKCGIMRNYADRISPPG